MPPCRLPVLIVFLLGCGGPPPQPAAGAGFRILDLPDFTRRFITDTGDIARPLHAFMWYPAETGTGDSISYRDYILYPGGNGTPGSTDATDRLARTLAAELGDTVEGAAFDRVLERAAGARRNASPRAGQFPVLLLEAGLNAPAFLYVDLAERLSPRGVRVITLPSFGSGSQRPLGFDTTGFATQRDDLRHAIRTLDPLIADAGVVIGGWSVGALSAALAAFDSNVRGVISLDGALGYDYGIGFSQILGLKPACLALPFLHLTGTRPSRFRVPKSRTFFEGLPGGNAWWATIPGLSHGDFTSYYSTRSPLFHLREDSSSVIAGWQTLEETVFAFIQYSMTDSSPALATLSQSAAVEQLRHDPAVEQSCSS
jgi:hypothetical protein